MNEAYAAVRAATAYAEAALDALRRRLVGSSLDAEQHAAHGYAWIATAAHALIALAAWHDRLAVAGEAQEADDLVLAIGLGETLAQLIGGLPMGQNEFVRPMSLGLEVHALESN